ncbi:hypothetical protein J4573_42710 [Actinomadura barringtoniae]|uniref:XRE family transcriptional regulator n=1 Tax=Actinomadura barringtoniae TaxID=1427535 RepID=A0A939T943_9ACTN|nr:hypothetical protein [Actinomadura barringtoniae]MBO2453864.1 hypothetical protein [Actinomadura barringtoniae]
MAPHDGPQTGQSWHGQTELNPEDEERLIKAACRPTRVDRSVIESLAAILAAQRRTEDVIGSGPLLGPVRAQLDMIGHLVAEARGPLRSEMVNVGGQWAQFYGWLRASCGDVAAGNRHLDRALEWATESADVDLVSEVVSFKGHLAWMSGQAGATIGLSAAAVRGDGLYPGQRAISCSQEARGHAMTGDAWAAEAKLDEADVQAAAARERLDDAPPWLYYHSPALFELERGLAYRYLGHHDQRYNQRAIKAFGQGLSGLPVEMRGSEWSGEFIYQLGRAHLQAGEREEAGRLAGDLTSLGERLGSDRLMRQAEALSPSS